MKTKDFLSVSTEGFHRVAYTEWGQPDPILPTVICVHGLLRNRHDFDALASYLSMQERHVLCPDVVGRGDSDWFEKHQQYTFPQYVADMTTLLARTSISQFDWIGTSMGGLIGMMMAGMSNSPISRLVLNDVGPQVPIHGLRRLAKYAGTQHKFSNKEEAKQFYRTTYADFGLLTESQWDDFTESSIVLDPSGTYVEKRDPNITHTTKTHAQFLWELVHHPHKTLEGVWFDIDLWSIWRQIKCPVLIIHGKHSDILLPEYITKMRDIHPGTDLIEVDDAGHAPALLEREMHEKINQWFNGSR